MKTTLKKTVTIVLLSITALLILFGCKKDKYPVVQVVNYNENIITLSDGVKLVSFSGNDTVTIKLLPINEITAHSARVTGNININTGGDWNSFDNFKYGICWDTVLTPTHYNSAHSEPKSVYEEFSLLIYDLLPNSKYNVNLYIEYTKLENNNTSSGIVQNTIINNIDINKSFTTLPE